MHLSSHDDPVVRSRDPRAPAPAGGGAAEARAGAPAGGPAPRDDERLSALEAKLGEVEAMLWRALQRGRGLVPSPPPPRGAQLVGRRVRPEFPGFAGSVAHVRAAAGGLCLALFDATGEQAWMTERQARESLAGGDGGGSPEPPSGASGRSPPRPPRAPRAGGRSGEGASPASLWGAPRSGAWALGDSPTAAAGGGGALRTPSLGSPGDEAGLPPLAAPSVPGAGTTGAPGPAGRGGLGWALQAFSADAAQPLSGWEAWSPRAAMPEHAWLQESPALPGDAATYCAAPQH